MIKFIDNITDLVLRAFFETHRIFLISITILVLMLGQFEINNIFYCSFIIILLGYIIGNKILKKSNEKPNEKSKFRKLFVILGIIIIVTILTFLFKYHSIYLKIFIFIYFLLIWLQGAKIVINNFDIETYFSKFITSIGIMIFFFPVYLGNISWIKTNLQNYFFSYFFIWLILIARIELFSAYSVNVKNTINKKKNTIKFSIITNFLLLTMLLFSIYSKSYFKSIFKYIDKYLSGIIANLLHIIVKYPAKFMYWVFYIIDKFQPESTMTPEDVEDSYLSMVEELKNIDNTDTHNSFIIKIIIILKWVIIFSVIIFLLYNIYRISKNFFKNKINDNEEEIKDFILTKEDILNKLKSPFKKLSKLFNKDKSLHIIRQIYIDIIIILDKSGYKFKKSFTPNEYIETIEEKDYEEKLLSLTKYYNIIRYSNKKTIDKEITDKEINNSIKIKNEIKRSFTPKTIEKNKDRLKSLTGLIRYRNKENTNVDFANAIEAKNEIVEQFRNEFRGR